LFSLARSLLVDNIAEMLKYVNDVGGAVISCSFVLSAMSPILN